MLVIAHHFVQNPDAFWATAQQATSSIPPNIKLHSVFPSTDLKTGTCVWEAASTGEVQDFLDKIFGNFSKNVCYEVKEEMAMGLPQKTMEEALSQ
ncbi:MAG: hypothetical protein ICV51_03425 [Flavisolibacter sp.]|nr:hypothetical protein [Flavisolibacter sp.]MBD0287009.1 hypothetical protein [Flavisolibacter sp.]MBD0351628.1 hypothetical protein [Flavisolibacter sp.]MBD0365869.1 hypothetical protein [Flavisolibacter sp.]MBD0374658.1 hypothetical protein [Flavisolibacter sp.]